MLSLSQASNQAVGSGCVHQPLSHTEDPQDHSLKIPELGSHERATHHPPLAWQRTKFSNQQGSASRLSLVHRNPPVPVTKPGPGPQDAPSFARLWLSTCFHSYLSCFLWKLMTGMEIDPSRVNTVLIFSSTAPCTDA